MIFEEFIEKEHYVWGNLIATDVYTESWDRINYINDWHKSKDFLGLVSKKQSMKEIGLKDFLIKMQKSFISQYESKDDLIKETSYKKQIFIYYILQFNSLIKNSPKWEWNSGWNFGVYDNFDGMKSLFENKYIYQFFDKQFRENESKLIWCHKNIANKSSIIENLLNWSKEL